MFDDAVFRDTPWLRVDAAAWETRRANLHHPRVGRLNALVEDLRTETNECVPWIDPFCGGEDAPVLVVLLRPGPKGAMETDFLCLANPDDTARNRITVMQAASLSYRDTCPWNAIPWPGRRDERISADMLARGAAMLQRLLPLMRRLRAVVLVGGVAGKLNSKVNWPPGACVLTCAHPGPFVWNQLRYRRHRDGIFDTFAKAARSARPD